MYTLEAFKWLAKLMHVKVALPIMLATTVAMGAGGAVAASLVISNVLKLGPSDLLVESVSLTTVKDFPSQIKPDQGYSLRFSLANNASAVADGLLIAQLSANGATLADPSMVDLRFKDPDTGNQTSVALTSVDGTLKGVLKSNWNIPAGYSGIAEVVCTFTNKAPPKSYSLQLWVESGGTPAGAVSPVPAATGTSGARTPQTYFVQSNDNKVFTPATITVHTGDIVRWTNVGTTPHTVTFADASIPSDPLLDGGQTYEVTFSAAGTYAYHCRFHTGQVGTVIVQ